MARPTSRAPRRPYRSPMAPAGSSRHASARCSRRRSRSAGSGSPRSATAMSGSAAFSATIDAMTSEHAQARDHQHPDACPLGQVGAGRSRYPGRTGRACRPWSPPPSARDIFETNSLVRRPIVSFSSGEVVVTMTAGRSDPRPARSRARLLDAATALLRSGGPSAVTIDAVTRSANVARATLVPPLLRAQTTFWPRRS